MLRLTDGWADVVDGINGWRATSRGGSRDLEQIDLTPTTPPHHHPITPLDNYAVFVWPTSARNVRTRLNASLSPYSGQHPGSESYGRPLNKQGPKYKSSFSRLPASFYGSEAFRPGGCFVQKPPHGTRAPRLGTSALKSRAPCESCSMSAIYILLPQVDLSSIMIMKPELTTEKTNDYLSYSLSNFGSSVLNLCSSLSLQGEHDGSESEIVFNQNTESLNPGEHGQTPSVSTTATPPPPRTCTRLRQFEGLCLSD
ncbi:hypothetical protein J6590_095166 [Homalodisca vitripennis]|nr:hypothetical protein J6590_095166 [Homalodisca vitripennis]